MLILTSDQMRRADRHAIDELGIASLDLMENAGAAVVGAIEDALGEPAELCVLVLCGTGNNGGDGMVVARLLAERGAFARALLLGDPAKLSREAAIQWKKLATSQAEVRACDLDAWREEAASLAACDLVVDAIFGTGFRGELRGVAAQVAMDLNDSPIPVVAIDVPSGLDGSAAQPEGPAIAASLTIALQAPKPCHVFPPASTLCGEVAIADIGIPLESLQAGMDGMGATIDLVERPVIARLIHPLAHRDSASHKGDFGHVLAVGGSLTHSGAIALTGMGALRIGAGLVTVASPADCTSIVASHAPELMHSPLGKTGGLASGALDGKDVVAIGPGLGTGPAAARLLRKVLDLASVPIVLDADALNLLALHGFPTPRPERPLVLTPHPGELARLAVAAGLDEPGDDQLARLPVARSLADRVGGIVVVKAARTLVVGEDEDVAVIATGNPGMATGGTGDVLSGVIAGLIAQGLPPREAAVAGAWLHGRAGDAAEEELGQMSLIASDLLRFLPHAVASLFDDGGGDDETEISAPPSDDDE